MPAHVGNSIQPLTTTFQSWAGNSTSWVFWTNGKKTMDSLGNKWDIDWPTIIKLSWKEVSIIATSQHCNAALQWAISPECSWKGVIILRIRAHVFVLDGIDVRGMWIEFSMVWRKRVCTLLIIARCPCWVKTDLFSWKNPGIVAIKIGYRPCHPC